MPAGNESGYTSIQDIESLVQAGRISPQEGMRRAVASGLEAQTNITVLQDLSRAGGGQPVAPQRPIADVMFPRATADQAQQVILAGLMGKTQMQPIDVLAQVISGGMTPRMEGAPPAPFETEFQTGDQVAQALLQEGTVNPKHRPQLMQGLLSHIQKKQQLPDAVMQAIAGGL